MYKHYIRLNEQNEILHAFSNAFEEALDGDICINTTGQRQLIINNIVNPNMTDLGVPLYKWENNEIVEV